MITWRALVFPRNWPAWGSIETLSPRRQRPNDPLAIVSAIYARRKGKATAAAALVDSKATRAKNLSKSLSALDQATPTREATSASGL